MVVESSRKRHGQAVAHPWRRRCIASGERNLSLIPILTEGCEPYRVIHKDNGWARNVVWTYTAYLRGRRLNETFTCHLLPSLSSDEKGKVESTKRWVIRELSVDRALPTRLLWLRTVQQYVEGVVICVSRHVHVSIVAGALIHNDGNETMYSYRRAMDKAYIEPGDNEISRDWRQEHRWR